MVAHYRDPQLQVVGNYSVNHKGVLEGQSGMLFGKRQDAAQQTRGFHPMLNVFWSLLGQR